MLYMSIINHENRYNITTIPTYSNILPEDFWFVTCYKTIDMF